MSFAFEKKAKAGLVAALSDATTGVAAQLRAIEIEDSLAPNSLPDPEAIVRYFAPSDSRSPLVQVYVEAQESDGAEWRNAVAGVDCTIGVSYNSDSDLGAAEDVMDRYLQAVRMVLHADPTCGGLVGQAWSPDSNRTLELTYESVTRHGRAIGVNVRIHDP